jgi:hypothetical protein
MISGKLIDRLINSLRHIAKFSRFSSGFGFWIKLFGFISGKLAPWQNQNMQSAQEENKFALKTSRMPG